MCDHLSFKETTSHKANRSSRLKVSLRHRRVKSWINYVCDETEGYSKVISPEIFGQVAQNFMKRNKGDNCVIKSRFLSNDAMMKRNKHNKDVRMVLSKINMKNFKIKS